MKSKLIFTLIAILHILVLPIQASINDPESGTKNILTNEVSTSPIDKNKEAWVDLFNGKNLDGWTINVGKRGDENSLMNEQIYDVHKGVIHVYSEGKQGSKQYNANLVHDSVFSSFHLQVKYRWLDKKFQPRTEESRDAGILFHLHTDPNKVWPPSIEMQMGDGKPGDQYVTGDIFVIHNSSAETPLENNQYKTGGELQLRGELAHKRNNRGITGIYAEKSHGKWNTIDLIVHGSEKAEYYLNGVLVNEVYNMKYKDSDGQWKPLESGQISVQAEWAELEYKTIRIKDLSK